MQALLAPMLYHLSQLDANLGSVAERSGMWKMSGAAIVRVCTRSSTAWDNAHVSPAACSGSMSHSAKYDGRTSER